MGQCGCCKTPWERAIVDTAHRLGRKVAAHSHAAEGTKAALEQVGFVMHRGVVAKGP